jgi:predicted RNA-binding protein YlxR (DUF448 family)
MANTVSKRAKQPKKPKHVPLRTCVACHETKPKRELLRVVHTPDNHVLIDATGKKSGRGAYLCARFSCWDQAMKKHRLEQEFEVSLTEEDRLGLEAYIATLPIDEVIPAASGNAKAKAEKRQRPVKTQEQQSQQL